jgi:tripartite-type tricarboxylate transporter receptor subunit TctC
MKRLSFVAAVVWIATVIAAIPAAAQDSWPARPVKIIVPSAPGGGTDAYARLMGSALGEALRQQFIVENRPGGNGNIGAEAVARAAPDGYTILVSASPALMMNQSLYANLSYNAERDFAPISPGVISPLLFCVHPSLKVRSLAELVALGKREPGKLTYGSAGQTSVTALGVRLLEEATGARFTNIPYKGLGQAYQNLLSGELSFMFSDVVTVLAQIRAGKIIPLAVSHRTGQLPGVPSVVDAGFPVAEVHASFMVAAPAGTPGAIVQRLNAEINRLMKVPDIASRLDAQVLIPVFETPEVFAASLNKQRDMWAAAIRRMGIKAGD